MKNFGLADGVQFDRVVVTGKGSLFGDLGPEFRVSFDIPDSIFIYVCASC
jgi:hypothetical protein